MVFNWDKLLSNKTFINRSEKSNFDERSPFDSDYSRITFSAPFRRLQDKTQVFPLEQNDYVRTRLTHSIEVASLARSIGKSIGKRLNNDDKYGWKTEYIESISTILECAGLVHDIGNPPFGHASEKAIQNWFKKCDNGFWKKLSDEQKADFTNFDGNVQGFRILTHLQNITDYEGYHLTSALLASSMKYPVSSVKGNKENYDDIKIKKFGYFDSEKEIARFVQNECGLLEQENSFRHPLSFIVEAADDIAYSAADIEDGFKKGLFSLGELKEGLATVLPELIHSESHMRDDGNGEHKIYTWNDEFLNDDNKPLDRKIQRLRILIHKVYCDSIVDAFINNYDTIMTGNCTKELLDLSDAKQLREFLKNFAFNKIVKNNSVALVEIAGKNVIDFLLGQFTDEMFNALKTIKSWKRELIEEKLKKGKYWQILSDDYKDIFLHTIDNVMHQSNNSDEIKIGVTYNLLLLITDFISGMTDNYCIRLYRKLMGIEVHN